ncbi:hypothetical protein VpaChn25_A1318 [Vibrio parahaemolyticus]|nr:hypothetical protein VPBB_A1302 [Vibrio parahaemolyticus BB22OP]ANZ12903.1 hypothetical protein VpaChn25_A1318 [Vibrio parahaemolyticus]EFO41479.1 conserved hypothetical protein [Vibrio parahaemolyticus AN-5034]ETT14273.1 hypothetical protein D028_3914 [Vibrio parahaemolyticus 50]EVT81559.1 hypothetical protein D032_0456 [Vibrio parahaemolyticus V14/01]
MQPLIQQPKLRQTLLMGNVVFRIKVKQWVLNANNSTEKLPT